MGARKGCRRDHYKGTHATECVCCDTVKPLDAFTPGNPTICKRCKYGHHIARTYGISLDDLEVMLKRQRGLCAICERRKPKYVDHRHNGGKVRGVLCQPCNTALGAFFDSPEIMQRAVTYVVAAIKESV